MNLRVFLGCLLLWVGAGGLARAQAVTRCEICLTTNGGQYFRVGSPALREKVIVCRSCATLDTVCSSCQLPVRDAAHKLDDGRLLCPRDFRGAVFSQLETERLFEETRRELVRILAGTGRLPNRNITVRLVNGIVLNRLLKSQHSRHDRALTMGVTRTRQVDRGEFEHEIFLLSGMNRSRLMAVAAHEYAHAWQHENLPPDRQIEGDTIEGFCELVAYKLMGDLREDLEQNIIRANNYSRGQIISMIQTDDDFRFYRVVEWMKSGVDSALSPTNTARVLALSDGPETPSPSPSQWLKALPTAVPETLTLKGISANGPRRFALLNNRTLEANESARVRVGDSNVLVRCVAIRERSVLLEVGEARRRQELFLRTDDEVR